MAGLFTHFLVCQKALGRGELRPELRRTLSTFADWMYLGAAAPDLPYVMFVGGQDQWADHMHYQNTSAVTDAGFADLRRLWSAQNPYHRARLAWLLGYVSHIITDVVVHPVLENAAVVGPYSNEANRLKHRECEKIQDALLFHDLSEGLDITYVEFADRFDNCRGSTFFRELMEFWKQLLIGGYPEVALRPEPMQWFSTFRAMFDLTDDRGGATALFRHLGGDTAASMVYTPYDTLQHDRQAEIAHFYTELHLPDGTIGNFRDAVFSKTVQSVCTVWNALFDSLQAAAPVAAVIKNWNLDTGKVLGEGDAITYWS